MTNQRKRKKKLTREKKKHRNHLETADNTVKPDSMHSICTCLDTTTAIDSAEHRTNATITVWQTKRKALPLASQK